MKRLKNKKIITILSIIFVISLIFIAGSVQAARLNSRAELVKGPNIGNTIYMTQTAKGPIQLFKEEDHVYCIQHKAYGKPGNYRVVAHADISGQDATIYTKSGSKVITSKANVILAYICGEESYSKGYGGVRMRAIHEYLVRPWYKDVGFKGGISKEWNDAGYSLNNHQDVKARAESLIKNAKNFAKNKNSIKPVINKKQSSTKMNSISNTTAGPFKIKYQGVIDTVTVLDNTGKAINQKNISFSTDKEGKKKVNATSLKSNVKYYVHNSSNKTFGKLSITLKASTTLSAKLWFLEKADGEASQRYLTVDTKKETFKAVTHVITIKQAVGNLTISKTDKDTGTKLEAGFKIQTPSGKWLSGTAGSYNYDKEYKDAQVYTAKGGSVTLKELKFGQYKIYEVKAAEGYNLAEQEGYDKTNNWVDFGTATIGENSIKVNKSFSNIKKVSIKGYVWIDVQRTKLNNANSEWDKDETRVAGVKVRLKNKANNQAIRIGNNDYVVTNANGEYVFEKLLTTGQLKDYYVEFDYKGVKTKSTINTNDAENKKEIEEEITGYIPVAFNSTDKAKIKKNGSRALMNNVPLNDYNTQISDNDSNWGKATTYTGRDSNNEKVYGLGYKGNLYDALIEGTTLNNINLGLKKIPEAEFSVTENLADVKISIKGYEYTYIYGGNGDKSRASAPKVNWQNKQVIDAYSRDIYPSDIVYRSEKSTEELKVDVTYRIDIANTTKYNMEELYKEKGLYITNVVNNYDAKRYSLNDENWVKKDGQEGTAIITDKYKQQIYDKPIGNADNNNSVRSKITFSVNRSALEDILKHPDGIIEENPTSVTATGYHEYSRKDYSWQNNIPQEQNHRTVVDTRKDDAPYLIFKLGDERVISGRVFEDKVVTTDGQKLGNGQDDKEKGVEGVKVELLDVVNNVTDITKLPTSNLYGAKDGTAISKSAQVKTDANGNYSLNGIVPGFYYIRFTYGDKITITDLSGKVVDEFNSKIGDNNINAKDYKSTIVTNNKAKAVLKGTDTDLVWYNHLNSTDSSVAIDNLSRRIAVNKGEQLNNIAGTAKLSITIENTGTETKTEVNQNAKKDDKGNDIIQDDKALSTQSESKFGGINLGIIEQPNQDVKFEKIITNIKLTNAQNNFGIGGNPELDSMQGVSDLDNVNNGGSTYVRVELADDMISSANFELTYGIKVTNTSDVNYYNNEYYWYGEADHNKEVTLNVQEIIDYLDDTLQYKADSSDTRIKVPTEIPAVENATSKNILVINEIGKLYTENNKARGNGNFKTNDVIALVAGRTLSKQDDDMEFINDVEITKMNMEKDSRDTTPKGDEEIQTVKPLENKYKASAKATITPPTGEDRQEMIIYVISGIMALAMLSVGIVMIKKIVTK